MNDFTMNFVLYTLIISQICRIIKYIYNNFSFHKGMSLCGQADARLLVYKKRKNDCQIVRSVVLCS